MGLAEDMARIREGRLTPEEQDIYDRKLMDLYRQSSSSPRALVDALRQIPARDERKKATLADFFASEAGQHYSKDDKRSAYDQLLGVERNKENRG